MAQKKVKITEKKQELLNRLKSFGASIYKQLDEGQFPTVNMPSRSTENITYDETLRQYILGDRSVGRSTRNIRHIKPFTQLAWVAMFSNELTSQRKTQPQDVYYRHKPRDDVLLISRNRTTSSLTLKPTGLQGKISMYSAPTPYSAT